MKKCVRSIFEAKITLVGNWCLNYDVIAPLSDFKSLYNWKILKYIIIWNISKRRPFKEC